jgi:hypothetical protein
MFVVVAIPIVECDRDEIPAEVALYESPPHFIHTHEFDASLTQANDRSLQELRLDLEETIGLKSAGPARPDMVQRKNRPDTAKERPQRVMGAGEIQRLEPGSIDRVTQVRQNDSTSKDARGV